jgi:hypothetical protein
MQRALVGERASTPMREVGRRLMAENHVLSAL